MNLKAPLFVFFFFSIDVLSAQQKKDSTQLPEVVILENRLATQLKQSSQNISYLTAQQVRELPVRSLPEVLAYVPGVDIRQRGPMGAQADISLRGGSFEQTLMLLNGIKLTDPQTGHHSLNLPLPLFSIQQIDVLKGPAARIYGQNAFNGAVNVITQPGRKRGMDLQVFGGDFNLRGMNAMLSLPAGKLRQNISVSFLENSGHRYNSDVKSGSLLYDALLPIGNGREMRTMLAISDRKMGANGFYSNRFPDQWEATRTGLASLSFQQVRDKNKISIRSYFRMNEDEFRLKRRDVSFYTNTHQSQLLAIEMNGVHRSVLGETGYGIDLRREAIFSSNLGNHSRNLAGVFLEHKLILAKRVDARAGVYGNYYSQYGLRFFPGAEVGFQLNSKSRLYTNWGYSNRIPTYTELYYKDLSSGSNPDLLPETARSAEVGCRFLENGWRAEANVFHRKTNQLIDYYRPAANGVNTALWLPRNISAVDFTGFEGGIGKDWFIRDSLFALKSLNFSYNFVAADLRATPGIETRYALDQLRQQVVLSAGLIIFKKVQLAVSGRYIERQNANAYALADARLSWNFGKGVQLFLESSNITNSAYIEAGYVKMPGRWTRGGINWKIGENQN